MSSANSDEDRIAIITLTRRGTALGRSLSQLLPASHLYLPEKFASGDAREHPFNRPAREVVRKAFAGYRQLVLIMAVGAAVRLFASELKGKLEDPAVVVLDEKGTFAVSLLSGHGGANELAKKAAHLLGAQAVVTTASEVSATIAIDLLGREFDWKLESRDNLTRVAASLVNGEPVGIFQTTGERNWWRRDEPLPANVHFFTDIESLRKSDCPAVIIITDQVLSHENEMPSGATVIYRPRSLVVGIGCNRGTSAREIETAITSHFSEHHLALASIRNMATIDLKKNEAGLLEFSRTYGLPIEYFNKDALSQVQVPSAPSSTVLQHVGTPAVCEAAAIISSGSPTLLVPKASYGRAVSIAVARLPFDRRTMPEIGKLFLVGLGPGAPQHMTFRAREALSISDVVVGYKSYVRLVEPFVAEKKVIASGMTEEVQRAKAAIGLAQQGRVVSLVCGGDSGIYGMAGLVGEVLHQQGQKLDVEVIPGVPALVASAALLGAPLCTDFACISLSDYLVPWPEIAQRLKLAAQAGFVIVIYNPRSKRRKQQLVEAREILRQYYRPSTPTGIVVNACREGQKVIITDLEHMLDHEIDMNTTIIVGNPSTFTADRWVITPRGYAKKYDLSTAE